MALTAAYVHVETSVSCVTAGAHRQAQTRSSHAAERPGQQHRAGSPSDAVIHGGPVHIPASAHGDKKRTFDELGHMLPNEGHALTVRVGTNRPDLRLELLRAVDDILRPLPLHELGERRVLHERGDLHSVSVTHRACRQPIYAPDE